MAGDYTHNPKNGIELPTLGGLRWLRMFGEALCIQSSGVRPDMPRVFLRGKVIRKCSVSTAKCCTTGHVTLEFRLEDHTKRAFRIPTGLINNMDTRELVKRIASDEFAGSFIFKDSALLNPIVDAIDPGTPNKHEIRRLH